MVYVADVTFHPRHSNNQWDMCRELGIGLLAPLIQPMAATQPDHNHTIQSRTLDQVRPDKLPD